MGEALVSGFGTKQSLQQLKLLLLSWLLCQWLSDKIGGKILLTNQNQFLFFQKKLKGELAMAYENYAGGILVICIEILNDYCFILY